MHPIRRQRLILVIFIIVGASLAVGLALYALNQNINLYYTPTQLSEGMVPKGRVFRIGGIVKPGTIKHAAQGLGMSFVLTDYVHNIPVYFNGVLPDLFGPGQGIVVQGKLTSNGKFEADQVLAKHGADYMPEAVKQSLKQAQQSQQPQLKKGS